MCPTYIHPMSLRSADCVGIGDFVEWTVVKPSFVISAPRTQAIASKPCFITVKCSVTQWTFFAFLRHLNINLNHRFSFLLYCNSHLVSYHEFHISCNGKPYTHTSHSESHVYIPYTALSHPMHLPYVWAESAQ